MATPPDPVTTPCADKVSVLLLDHVKLLDRVMLPASVPAPAVDTVTLLFAKAFCKVVAFTTPPEAEDVNVLLALVVLALAPDEMVML